MCLWVELGLEGVMCLWVGLGLEGVMCLWVGLELEGACVCGWGWGWRVHVFVGGAGARGCMCLWVGLGLEGVMCKYRLKISYTEGLLWQANHSYCIGLMRLSGPLSTIPVGHKQ